MASTVAAIRRGVKFSCLGIDSLTLSSFGMGRSSDAESASPSLR